MLRFLPPDVSTFGHAVDRLFVLITILTGVGLVVAEVALGYAVVRYRKRRQARAVPRRGRSWRELRWIFIPLALLVGADAYIDIQTHDVWAATKESIPPADQTVRITGQQFIWTFTYPGRDGRLGTADDFVVANELHVPVGETIVFELEARDVLHSFSVPALRLKQDAVPGRTIRGWFKALTPGTYGIACSQICGVGHGVMAGRLIVQTRSDYDRWVESREPPAVAPAALTTPRREP